MRARLVVLLLAAPAFAQDVEEISSRFLRQEQEAFAFYNAKDYARAVAAFEVQIAIYPDNPRPYYNIACCYALEGNAERAGTWLLLAIARGWRDAEHLAQDSDFDGIRQSPDYIRCLAQLKRARDRDPDPMPRSLPLGSVPPAPSVSTALALSQLQESAVREMEVLYDEHRFRRSLFDVLDRRMAMLGRYIVENGDAADAADASVARVGTAALYLSEAEGSGEPDKELREAGAECVLRTVEEFLRGYPGDSRLPEVLLARAVALKTCERAEEAVALVRTVAEDNAVRARIDPTLRARLLTTRLFCAGMPDLLDLDEAAAARVAAHDGLVAYVFVSCGDPRSERLLAELPDANEGWLPVVVNVDLGAADPEGWLRRHARSFPTIARGAAAIERVGLGPIPVMIVAKKDGTVVAVDPGGAEIARLRASAERAIDDAAGAG